ncbi:hypothetical protein L486_03845 [Kwoniella mangroviensis CBS 10435]|uniref:Uncharacterized protein n=1 Tax=Kwoniella mangroviensis CBS 10435 TaxID=1331196 RepID=A0A1B9IUY3_9TREE|nr:hypothetical protein L486_03845 [Kwoniella mangroviensis CBS 10435]
MAPRSRSRTDPADEEIPRLDPPLTSAPPRSAYGPQAGNAYFMPPPAASTQTNQVADMFTMMGDLLRDTSTGAFSQNTIPLPNSTYGLRRASPQSVSHSVYPTNNMWSTQGVASFPTYNSGYGNDIVDLPPNTMYTIAHQQPLSTQNLDYYPGVRGYGNQSGTPTQYNTPMTFGAVADRSVGSSRPLVPAARANYQGELYNPSDIETRYFNVADSLQLGARYESYSRAASTTSSSRGGSKRSGKDQLTIIFTDPSGSKKSPGTININGRRKHDWDHLQDDIDLIVGRSRAVFSTEYPGRSENEAPPPTWGAIEYHYEGKGSASVDLPRGLVRPDDVPRMKEIYQKAINLGKRIESGSTRTGSSRDDNSSTISRSQGQPFATDTVRAWASGVPTSAGLSTPSISSIAEAPYSQGDAYSLVESELGPPKARSTVLEGAIRPMQLNEGYDDE